MTHSKCAPFVKWAGGKRQLLSQIRERMPKKYNNYFEPFVGGGAVFFELLPEKALINDINRALINAYRRICNSPQDFLSSINKLDADMGEDEKKYYYALREHYNDKLMREEFDTELAALFVFLNKHCFNGLYRVNGKGLFNARAAARPSARQFSSFGKLLFRRPLSGRPSCPHYTVASRRCLYTFFRNIVLFFRRCSLCAWRCCILIL